MKNLIAVIHELYLVLVWSFLAVAFLRMLLKDTQLIPVWAGLLFSILHLSRHLRKLLTAFLNKKATSVGTWLIEQSRDEIAMKRELWSQTFVDYYAKRFPKRGVGALSLLSSKQKIMIGMLFSTVGICGFALKLPRQILAYDSPNSLNWAQVWLACFIAFGIHLVLEGTKLGDAGAETSAQQYGREP